MYSCWVNRDEILRVLRAFESAGRVLGARGLPRIILECQLRLLHQELCAAVPAKTDIYRRLLEASRLLHRRRAAILADEPFDAVAAQFETRVSALHDRLTHAGVLIVSAVLDAHDDVPSAVESLTTWLTDAERFSADWSRAIEQTLSGTRGLLPTG